MTNYAIFLDLDGTSLSNDNTMNQHLISVVDQLQLDGHKVFINTGRQFYSSIPFHQQLKLDTPLITLNGGVIYDANGNVLFQTTIAEDFLATFLADQQYHHLVQANFLETPNKTISSSKDADDISFFYKQMPYDLQPNIDFLTTTPENHAAFQGTVNILSLLDDTAIPYIESFIADYQAIHKEQSTVNYRLTTSSQLTDVAFCEFFPHHAQKSAGIDWVTKQLNLTDYQTFAIGDGTNDLDMLQTANHGVAMQNATDFVKAHADAVTTYSNVDDGVARYLTDFFL